MYINAPTLALKSVQIDVGLKKNVSDFYFFLEIAKDQVVL